MRILDLSEVQARQLLWAPVDKSVINKITSGIEYKDLLNTLYEYQYKKFGAPFYAVQTRLEKYLFEVLYRPVYERCGYYCSGCRSIKALGIHHIDRDHDNMADANMTILCQKCHGKMHRKNNIVETLGYRKPSGRKILVPRDGYMYLFNNVISLKKYAKNITTTWELINQASLRESKCLK